MLQPRVLTIRAAAREFSLPVAAVRRWVATGQVKSITSGSRYYVLVSSLAELLGETNDQGGAGGAVHE